MFMKPCKCHLNNHMQLFNNSSNSLHIIISVTGSYCTVYAMMDTYPLITSHGHVSFNNKPLVSLMHLSMKNVL